MVSRVPNSAQTPAHVFHPSSFSLYQVCLPTYTPCKPLLVPCNTPASASAPAGGTLQAAGMQLLHSGPEGIPSQPHPAVPSPITSVPLHISSAGSVHSFSPLLSPTRIFRCCVLNDTQHAACRCTTQSVLQVALQPQQSIFIPPFLESYALRQDEGGTEVTRYIVAWEYRQYACLQPGEEYECNFLCTIN